MGIYRSATRILWVGVLCVYMFVVSAIVSSWSVWSEWSPVCGSVVQTRARDCVVPNQQLPVCQHLCGPQNRTITQSNVLDSPTLCCESEWNTQSHTHTHTHTNTHTHTHTHVCTCIMCIMHVAQTERGLNGCHGNQPARNS